VGDILSFPEKVDPHLAGEAKCVACKFTWAAVAPVGTVDLECPNCGGNRGIWRYPILAPVGGHYFVCNCGCEAMTAYFSGGNFYLRCIACGLDHSEAIMGAAPPSKPAA